MNTIRILSLVFLFCLTSSVFPQGSLTPPAGPAPTMKTLDQIEPRTRIPGGTSGFTITTSGSYYLSGNLAIASGNGITINADNVTLDLGGFEIASTGGGSKGVAIGNPQSNITIRHGAIRNFADRGIAGATGSKVRVENVRALSNGNIGISVGDDGAVIDCLVEATGADGIAGGNNCVVRNCQSIGNNASGARGIVLGNGAQVSGCVTNNNASDGISAGDNCLLDSCTSSQNSGHGFNFVNHCSVVNCAANGNNAPGVEGFDDILVTGSTVNFNNSIGIYINGGLVTNCTVNHNATDGVHNFGNVAMNVVHCDISYNGNNGVITDGAGRIEGCSMHQNVANGIQVESHVLVLNNFCDNGAGGAIGSGIRANGSANRIEGNNVTNEDSGVHVTAAGNLIIRNSASANVQNYQIVAGNTVGPSVTSANIATNNNPHANYDF